jgi:hypothetical protein
MIEGVVNSKLERREKNQSRHLVIATENNETTLRLFGLLRVV